jgi:FtsH-binding integral membrane protein
MVNGFIHAHSGWRWIVLILLVSAIFYAFANKNKYHQKINLFALIATHVQLILGLLLFYLSPKVQFSEGFMKNPISRFYTVEHTVFMLLAILLITLGYARAKRASNSGSANKNIRLYYGLGLILILISIPWPFRNLGAGWF